MASNPWKNMFPPHIWQRGVDYYRDGCVLDLHYRSSEVTAQVESRTPRPNTGRYGMCGTGGSRDCPGQ